MPIPLITPRTPGLLTREEFASYLQVGINEIPIIVVRFELEPVEGRFPWRSIWRQVMGIEPADPEQEQLLRQQLQGIGWVARQVGRGASTVRRKVREGRFEYPAPVVDLGNPEIDSRLKRWLPAQILARKRGDDVPVFSTVEPVRRADAGQNTASDGQEELAGGPENNVFAEIIRAGA